MGAAYELLGTLASGNELLRVACELEPCAEQPASDEKPSWIHITPVGPHIEARDGRKFTLEDCDKVVANTELPMLIDWEHASERGDTRAAGWVNELKVEREDDKAGIWGKAEWTKQGREHVSTRHYRFLSPVLLGKRVLSDNPREPLRFHVDRITSVALTNRPALRMHGIEQFREQLSQRLGPFAQAEDEETMDKKFRAAVCSAFGLQPDADDTALAKAAQPLIALARKVGDGDDDAPPKDRAALAELKSELAGERQAREVLQKELNGVKRAAFRRNVEVFFDRSVRTGRVSPAQRKKWEPMCCKSTENFRMFREDIYPSLPPMPLTAQAPKSPKSRKAKFSDESPHGVDRAALKSLGFSEAVILEAESELYDSASRAKLSQEDDDDESDDDGTSDDSSADDNDDDNAAEEGDENDDSEGDDDGDAASQTGG